MRTGMRRMTGGAEEFRDMTEEFQDMTEDRRDTRAIKDKSKGGLCRAGDVGGELFPSL